MSRIRRARRAVNTVVHYETVDEFEADGRRMRARGLHLAAVAEVPTSGRIRAVWTDDERYGHLARPSGGSPLIAHLVAPSAAWNRTEHRDAADGMEGAGRSWW